MSAVAQRIAFEKKGIKFELEHNKSSEFTVFAEGLFHNGKKVESLTCYYRDKSINFTLYGYLKLGKIKVEGVTIDDASVAGSIEALIESRKQLEAVAFEAELKDIQAHRPLPFVNENEYVVYSIGCDTGLIQHDDKEVIKLALNNGAKVLPILRGQRDSSNKYPGCNDCFDSSYATKVEGKWVADGYKNVYEYLYCIPVADFNAAKKVIESQNEAEARSEEENLKAAFAKAKETGQPVLISKIVVDEKDSPLWKDGEGDLVDICKLAMPDGTIQEKCFHNY